MTCILNIELISNVVHLLLPH